MKKAHICCMMALLTLFTAFSGCTAANDYPPALELRNIAPPERGEDANTSSFEAELYFLSQDQKSFSVERRELFYDAQTSRAEAAVQALIAGPVNFGVQRSVPVWFTLNRVELCSDACNVYFEGMYVPDASAWLTIRAAVAATVVRAEGVGTVNVFFNELEQGYLGYPLGGTGAPDEELSVYLRNLESGYSALKRAESGVRIDEDTQYATQTASLYLANAEENLLVARSVELNYPEGSTKADLARMLVEELGRGDTGAGNLEPVLPVDFRLLTDPIEVYAGVEEDGSAAIGGPCIIRLVIAEPAAPNYDETILCGALTMTITGFIPNVMGVEICIGKEPEPVAPEAETTQPDTADAPEEIEILETIGGKTFRRADFTERLGHTVTLYYPDADGFLLHAVPRVIPEASLNDPLLRVQELLGGYAAPGVPYPLFTAEDVKDVYVTDGVAVIDWNEGFSEKLTAFIGGDYTMEPSRRESVFIYGLVNTLTEMPMITSVWMLENGEKIGTVEHIYLGNALLRNPGLIAEE